MIDFLLPLRKINPFHGADASTRQQEIERYSRANEEFDKEIKERTNRLKQHTTELEDTVRRAIEDFKEFEAR
ncbi:MAG TPA: hypothetical protein PK745_00100 [bacterium]|nr:hypothetical protein [bacterium]